MSFKFRLSNRVLLAAALVPALALLPRPASLIAQDSGSRAGHAQSANATPASGASSYKAVVSILQQKCFACHSSEAKMGGFVMASYQSLLKGGTHGAEIVPRASAKSRLVMMIEGTIQPRMPFGGNPLSPAEIAVIKNWIDAGAKGPAPGEAATLQPKLNIPNLKPRFPEVSPVGSVAFSLNGKILAVGGYKQVRLVDPQTGKVLNQFSGAAGLVRSVAFSPDGEWLAAGGGLCQQWGEIQLWNLQSGRLGSTMRGHNDCIYSVAFSPDGKLLASGSYDKLIKLWDPASGKVVRTLKDHIDAVFAVAFSPDGKWLASGSQDNSVKIWNVATGERLYTLSDPVDGISTIAFSPSGKQLAAAGYDMHIYIWNLAQTEGTLVQSLIADENSILQIAWSPDGKEIISSSSDGSIRIRDASTLDPIRTIPHQSDWVDTMSLSPDGKWLAAGRFDGTLSVYRMGSFEQTLGPLVMFKPYVPARQSARAQSRNVKSRRVIAPPAAEASTLNSRLLTLDF
jgi:DNA-binding beta-propeller fold protein YncE/mono/diheme cytochrome c family protein